MTVTISDMEGLPPKLRELLPTLDATLATTLAGITASAAEINLLDGAVKGAHIADAKVNYTTGDLDAEAEIITAINATNTKLNAVLAALEGFLVVASS